MKTQLARRGAEAPRRFVERSPRSGLTSFTRDENTPSSNQPQERVRCAPGARHRAPACSTGSTARCPRSRRRSQQRDACRASAAARAGTASMTALHVGQREAGARGDALGQRSHLDRRRGRSRPSRRRSPGRTRVDQCARSRRRRSRAAAAGAPATRAAASGTRTPPKSKTTFMRAGARQQAGGGSVEPLRVARLAKRGSSSLHSALPSSTPHWSKLLMPHSAPLVNTRCSYSAISAPSARGVSCVEQQRRARPVAGEGAVARQRVADRASLDAVGAFSASACSVRLAEHQRLRSAPGSWPAAWCAGRPGRASACLHRDELDRDHVGALVQHLEVRVLAVGAGLAPHHRAGARTAAPRRRGRRTCRCSPSRAAAGRPAAASGPGGTARRCGS